MSDEIVLFEEIVEAQCCLVDTLKMLEIALCLRKTGNIGGDSIPRCALCKLAAKRRSVERVGDMLAADCVEDAIDSLLIHGALQRPPRETRGNSVEAELSGCRP